MRCVAQKRGARNPPGEEESAAAPGLLLQQGAARPRAQSARVWETPHLCLSVARATAAARSVPAPPLAHRIGGRVHSSAGESSARAALLALRRITIVRLDALCSRLPRPAARRAAGPAPQRTPRQHGATSGPPWRPDGVPRHGVRHCWPALRRSARGARRRAALREARSPAARGVGVG